MIRNRPSVASFVLGCLSMLAICLPAIAAQPAGLLGQAIEEEHAAPKVDAAQVKEIVRQADDQAAKKNFAEAIKLYSKAYRLAPSDQSCYARLLIAKRAAGTLTAEDREALDSIHRQQATQVQQALESVRLDLIQSKSALREKDAVLARSKVEHARTTIDGLPPDVDVSIYRNQIKTALANIGQHEVRAAKARGAQPTGRSGDHAALTLADQGVASTSGTASSTTQLTVTRAGSTSSNSTTTGEIVNGAAIADYDQEQHVYARSVAAALNQNRVDWVLQNQEAAIAPVDEMQYPSDWIEKTKSRAKYRDGVIYESRPFQGADGQTYTTAIYDIGDLVCPVPNFYASYPGTAREQRTQELDRMYLRMRSQIFNGYADDLAAGLPLLHFFGGIDNDAISTQSDPNQVARVMRTIELFMNGPGGGAPQNAPQGLTPGS